MNTFAKAVLVSAVAAVIATPALATTSWAGNSGTVYNVGCSFFNIAAGAMSLDVDNNKWTTTRGGSISVRSRGVPALSVTSDNVLRTEAGASVGTATVDYRGAGGTPSAVLKRSGSSQITSTALTIRNLNASGTEQISVFTLGGTATMAAGVTSSLSNDTSYSISHTATCTQ